MLRSSTLDFDAKSKSCELYSRFLHVPADHGLFLLVVTSPFSATGVREASLICASDMAVAAGTLHPHGCHVAAAVKCRLLIVIPGTRTPLKEFRLT